MKLPRLFRGAQAGHHRLGFFERGLRLGGNQFQNAQLELIGRRRRQLVQIDAHQLIRFQQAPIRVQVLLLQFAVGIDDHGDPILFGIAVLEEAADLRQQVRVDRFRSVELRLPQVGRLAYRLERPEDTVESNGRGLVFDRFQGVALRIGCGSPDEVEETARQLLEQPEEQRIALHGLRLNAARLLRRPRSSVETHCNRATAGLIA